LQILRFVRIGDLNSLKNIRLTCRAFGNIGAGLLFADGVVTVHIDERSVYKLTEISKHATIAKGVRYVEVNLTIYSTRLALSVSRFARRAVWELSETESRILGRSHFQNSQIPIAEHELEKGLPRGDDPSLHQALHWVRRLIKILGDYRIEKPIPAAHRDTINILTAAHEEFRARRERQDRATRRPSTFARLVGDVGNALARMPGVETLAFNAAPPVWNDQRVVTETRSPAGLRRFLLRPLGWSHCASIDDRERIEFTTTSALHCLVGTLWEIPIAAHKAGAVVRALTYLNFFEPIPLLLPFVNSIPPGDRESKGIVRDLVAATRSLAHVCWGKHSLQNRGPFLPEDRFTMGHAGLAHFLTLLLSAEGIQSVDLSLGGHVGGPRACEITKALLQASAWRNLRSFSMSEAACYGGDLALFFACFGDDRVLDKLSLELVLRNDSFQYLNQEEVDAITERRPRTRLWEFKDGWRVDADDL
jgi:hypothetical protein